MLAQCGTRAAGAGRCGVLPFASAGDSHFSESGLVELRLSPQPEIAAVV